MRPSPTATCAASSGRAPTDAACVAPAGANWWERMRSARQLNRRMASCLTARAENRRFRATAAGCRAELKGVKGRCTFVSDLVQGGTVILTENDDNDSKITV
jgi:hypothetical protein